MPEWESKQLADSGTLKQLADAGEEAITSINAVLTLVKGGAEIAKTFLTTFANPAAALIIAAADAIIASLQNYKESGYFILFIHPLDEAYGQKYVAYYGDKMKTDACRKLGIRLIVVPYKISVDDIPEFIENKLEKFKIK